MLIHLSSLLWHGVWIDVEQAFAIGRGVAPALTCQFQLGEEKGLTKGLHSCLPHCNGGTTACCVLPDRWFLPHFAIRTEFFLSLSLCTGRHCSHGQSLLAPLASLLG